MEKYYLAIDIGASSGRHILSRREAGLKEPEGIAETAAVQTRTT